VTLALVVVWQLWWTNVAADSAQRGAVSRLAREFAHPRTGSPAISPAPLPGVTAYAILRVPRFGAGYAKPVLEGTGSGVLDEGVGHYLGTAEPGGLGNVALAGHRTTHGRPFADIDRLRAGDVVVVETRTAFDVYVVRRHEIVPPTDTAVIAPTPDRPGAPATGHWLTMTACHPKFSAAQRYVVFAELVHAYPHALGLPAGTLTPPAG
jgi:sortase A